MFINYAVSYAGQEKNLLLKSQIRDFTDKLQGMLQLIKDLWNAEDQKIQSLHQLADHSFTLQHQIKLNKESPFMPRWTVGYVTREIMLLEISSSIMCLILAGKVGSNIASELGTMRVTQQIDALEIMGVNSANYLILPKIAAMVSTIPLMVTFSIFAGIIGAFCTCWFGGIMSAVDLEYGLQYMFVEWFIWCGIIKSLFFAFIIASVSAFFGYTVEGGSIEVGKASTDSVVCSSVLILFADLILTQLLMG